MCNNIVTILFKGCGKISIIEIKNQFLGDEKNLFIPSISLKIYCFRNCLMGVFITSVFGNKQEATMASLVHQDVALIVLQLWGLESDWKKKAEIVGGFVQKWDMAWNLKELKSRIRAVRRIGQKD